MLVGLLARLGQDRRALPPRVLHALVHVGHGQREVDDAVAVRAVMIEQRAARVHPPVDHEPGRAGRQHVGLERVAARLRPAVGGQVHAEHGLVEVRGLGGVAHREDHRVQRGDRERIRGLVVVDQPDQLPQLARRHARRGFVGRQVSAARCVRAGRHGQAPYSRCNL